MTTYFVSAVDGNNANDGLAWSGGGHAPKQTVAGALAIPPVSNDIIVVDNAGTFTASGAITWTMIGGNISIISVTRSGTATYVPSAGATESIGATSAPFLIGNTANAAVYMYGMTINGTTHTGNTATNRIGIFETGNINSLIEFDTCSMSLLSTGSTPSITIGPAGSSQAIQQSVRFKNTTITFASKSGSAFLFRNAKIEMINPTFSFGATKPTPLFSGGGVLGTAGAVIVRDGDISSYTGSALVGIDTFLGIDLLLANLKISATPTITSGSWTRNPVSLTLRNVDSGDTTYVFSYYNPYGTLTTTTSSYKNSGVTFGSGAIPASWKIVTTSVCSQYSPFRIPPILIWDTTLTAQTSAIEFAQDSSATALTDQDIWSDLDSAASASFPNYTWQSNRNAQPITGTPANQPTSTATWTGLTTPTTQKLNNAFTAAEVGLLQSIISIGKATTTLYINPNIDGVT